MQFLVLSYDGKDVEALNRRMAVREEHLRQAKEWFDAGKWLYAAGILDDYGKMTGSMIVCEFDSKEELENKWLSKEPYVINNVWEKVVIHPAAVPPFLKTKV